MRAVEWFTFFKWTINNSFINTRWNDRKLHLILICFMDFKVHFTWTLKKKELMYMKASNWRRQSFISTHLKRHFLKNKIKIFIYKCDLLHKKESSKNFFLLLVWFGCLMVYSTFLGNLMLKKELVISWIFLFE